MRHVILHIYTNTFFCITQLLPFHQNLTVQLKFHQYFILFSVYQVYKK